MTTRLTRPSFGLLALALGAATLVAVGAGTPDAEAATVTIAAAPTVIINEMSTMNLTGATDEVGDQGDWVELFNTGTSAVDLAGWGLSNTDKSPFKWVFPTGATIASRGYLRVWTDKADRTTSMSNLHANFNVDNAADQIVLSAPDGSVLGQLVDKTLPARSTPDVSWCRMPSGLSSSPFVACLTPTVAAANTGATATGLLSTPTLSVPSGVYPSARQVTASPGTADVDAGSVLRYTTDGSAPIVTSPLVTGPINVATSTALRVAAFKAGALTSYTALATYVIDSTGRFAGQRAMFVSMRPSDRSSFTGGGSAPSTGWRAGVEMLAPDGTRAFAAEGVTEDAGQIGSRNGQKTLPMEIKFKDASGVKSVSYPIFSSKPGQSTYKRLRLRNSGDDYQEAHLRDQFWQAVGTEANLAPAAYEPVQVFLNGSYYGMMDLREKEDENLIEATYGVDKDDVQYMSDSAVSAGTGTAASFDATYNYIKGTNMSVPANYARAADLLDMENFVQDFAIHMFAADRDWQNRNMHYFRMPSYDGKWRYRIHDVDISSDGTSAFFFDTSTSTDMNSKYCCDRSGTMMKALLANPTFKALYANVIADQLNTVLKPAESQARLDAMAASLAPYMPAHIATNGSPKTVAAWQTEVTRLRTFLAARAPFYLTNTRSYLGLGAMAPVTVGVTDPAQGTVKVNTVNLASRLVGENPTWTGQYWAGVPVTLTALPKVGYAFASWSDGSTSRTRTVTAGSAGTFVPTFTVLDAASTPAPVVTPLAATQALKTGILVDQSIVASDPTGYPLTYKAKDLPKGMDLNVVTGKLYGKPTRQENQATVFSISNGPKTTKFTVNFSVTNQLNRTVVFPSTLTGTGTGLKAVYSKDAVNGGTTPVTRTEVPSVNYGTGAGPFSGWPTSSWSIRWTGSITGPTTGTYSLRAAMNTDDGVRVIVDGVTLFDTWTTGATTKTGTITLEANVPKSITIEFVDKSGAANLAMSWLMPGQTAYTPLIAGVLDPVPPPTPQP